MTTNNESNNLWQIVNYDDLVYFLKGSLNAHIMLGIVLPNTPKTIKTTIKTYIKNKSKLFPNVTFLYYVAKNTDIGKNTLLDKDASKYPFVYCIYNTKHILAEVSNVDGYDAIDECFNEIENDYAIHLHQWENKDRENEQHEFQKQIKIQKNLQEQANTEKKKLLDKLIVLKEKGAEYQMNFVEDIAMRRKEELSK